MTGGADARSSCMGCHAPVRVEYRDLPKLPLRIALEELGQRVACGHACSDQGQSLWTKVQVRE